MAFKRPRVQFSSAPPYFKKADIIRISAFFCFQHPNSEKNFACHRAYPLFGNFPQNCGMLFAALYAICVRRLSFNHTPLCITAIQTRAGLAFLSPTLFPPLHGTAGRRRDASGPDRYRLSRVRRPARRAFPLRFQHQPHRNRHVHAPDPRVQHDHAGRTSPWSSASPRRRHSAA